MKPLSESMKDTLRRVALYHTLTHDGCGYEARGSEWRTLRSLRRRDLVTLESGCRWFLTGAGAEWAIIDLHDRLRQRGVFMPETVA